MKLLSLLLSIIAIIGVVILFQKFPINRAPVQPHGVSGNDHEIELAVVMGRIQRFHQKFWLSVRAGNTELTRFYLHELEEGMEEIAEAGVMEDGIDVSANMRTYGLKVIEQLEDVLEKEGVRALEQQADLLVNSCNSCHKVSGYGMVMIQVPEDVRFPDQVFDPIAQ